MASLGLSFLPGSDDTDNGGDSPRVRAAQHQQAVQLLSLRMPRVLGGSTKGAYKLSSLGFQTKELLGGLDWWRRDGHAVLSGPEPGDIHQAKKLAKS